MPAIAGQFALDAQSEPGSASGGISGLGAIIDHNQDGAETGGFADLLSSILAAPSSGAMLLANAKSSPTSPTSSAALKAASARAATTLLLNKATDPNATDAGTAAPRGDDPTNAPAANDADPTLAKSKDSASAPEPAPAPSAMADAMLPTAATLQLLASLVSSSSPALAAPLTQPTPPASGQETAPVAQSPAGTTTSLPLPPNALAPGGIAADPKTVQAGAAPAVFASPPTGPASLDASSTPQNPPVVVTTAPVNPTPTGPTLADATSIQLAAQAAPSPASAPPRPPPVSAPPVPAAVAAQIVSAPAAVQDVAPPSPLADPNAVALAASAPPPSLAAAVGPSQTPIAGTHAATSSTGPQTTSASLGAAPPVVAQIAASGGAPDGGARQDASGDRPHGDPAPAAPVTAPQASDPGATSALAAAAPAAAAQAPSQPTGVNSQTVSRLASGIVQNLKSKASRFQLALEPAGLGRVDISVRIGADGALSATLNFNSTQAADALKAHAGELRAALQQAGFNLGGSDLSFMTGNSGQQQGGSQGQSTGRQSFASAAAPEPQGAVSAPISQTVASGADGLDIRI